MTHLAKRGLSVLLAGVGCGLALPLHAAPALEEVIVTAQKREQSIQDAPIAISALTSTTLEEKGISTIEGVTASAPNVVVVPTVGGSVNAGINIRGAASNVNNLDRDAAVGVYLDGVPIAKSSGAIFDVADLERIEVLRGPQGTLYGKNTMGGAINLITARPSGRFGGKAEVTLGSENLRMLRAHVDTPALGTSGEGAGSLAAKVSYYRKLRDGFIENDHPSTRDFDNQNQWSTRLALAWELNEHFSADYAYDRFELRQRPTALQVVEVGSYGNLPLFGPAVRAAYSRDRLDSVSNDASLQSDVRIEGHTLTLNYDFGELGALGEAGIKYIFGHRDLSTDSLSDFDGTALDFSRFGLFNEFRQITHELQWLGSTDSTDYVIGLFYYEDHWDTDNPRWNGQVLAGRDGVFETNQRGAKDRSYAAFGQLDWQFNDWLELTFGIRWTYEEKDVYRLRVSEGLKRGTVAAGAPLAGVFVRDAAGNAVLDVAGNYQALRAKDDWSEVTPMFVVNVHLTDEVSTYLKVATGFKSGGFNGVSSTNADFVRGFDPETMTTYELGFKSRFWDQRVQLNASVFYNDYEDYQADVYVPEALGIGVVNAGQATSSGMELELTALVLEGLELTLNYGYLDFGFDEYLITDQATGTIVDVKDDRTVAYNMRHNVAAGLRYTRDLGFGTLVGRIDYSFFDRHYLSGDPASSITPQQYSLWNARLGLTEMPVGDSARLALSLWGRNLADEEYIVSGLVFPNRGMAVATFGDPRSFGVDLKVEF